MLEWMQICLIKLTKANIRPTQEGLRSPNTHGPKGLMNWNKKPDAFYRKANSNSKTIISNGWKRRSTSRKLCLNVEKLNFLRKKTQSFMIVSLEIGGGGGHTNRRRMLS
jgi:hypothetical protein